MENNGINFKKVLLDLRKNITNDRDAVKLIDHAINNLEHNVDLNKVVFELDHDLNNYSLTHNFKLPSTLTKLKIMIDENPDKWSEAGLTGSI